MNFLVLKENIKEYKNEIGIFLVFWLVYTLTITQNYSLSHDSTYYLNDIEFGDWYFHPHHLLFHIVFKIWNDFLSIFQFLNTIDISYKVGVINALFGALNLSAVYSFLTRKINYKNSLAIATVSLIGFSWAHWYYSGCFEVYIIPLFFITLTMFNAYEYLEDRKSIVPSAVYLSIAILFHQSNIFLLFPMLYIIYLKDKSTFITNSLKPILIGFMIILIPYLFAGVIFYKNYSIQSYWHWLTLYGSEVPEHWSKLGKKMFINDIVGFLRTFYSSYFLYSIDGFQQLIYKAFPDKWLGEETFLVRNMATGVGLTLMAIITIAFVNVVVIVIKNYKNVKSNFLTHKKLIKILLSVFIALTVFFTFWSSNNLEFWIPQNMIFWIVFIVLFKDESKFFTISILILAISNLSVNYMAGSYYCSNKNDDYFYRKISAIKAEKPENILLITPNPLVLNDYLKRYKVKNTMSLYKYFEANSIEKLEDTLNSFFSRGNTTVYATDDLIKIEKEKYAVEFLDFLKQYFSSENFEIIIKYENQPEEYYILKKRN